MSGLGTVGTSGRNQGPQQESGQGGPELLLNISDDSMRASLTVKQTSLEQKVTPEEVRELLQEKSVVFGIREEDIARYCQTGDYRAPLICALGMRPVDEEDGKLIYHFDTEKVLKPTERSDGSLDFRELGLVKNISKGDVLCSLGLPAPGKPGKDIFGREIPFRAGRKPVLPVGTNTAVSEDGLSLLSTADGCIELLKNRINVNDVYVVLAPYAICLENNKMRKRHVPESVIENMYKNWYTPYCYEGWDDITLWYSSEYADDLQIKGWVDRMKSFDQQNSYHNLTLGDHCECVQEYFGRYCDNGELFRGHINELHDAYSACLLHDCGKPFTKEIRDGEAHYYGHQCVGAYDSLFFQTYNLKDPLFRSVLVNWHMQPYSWKGKENSKTEQKYKKLWGDRLYNIIMLLHEADVNAH